MRLCRPSTAFCILAALTLSMPKAHAQSVGFDTLIDEFATLVAELSAWTQEHNSELVEFYSREIQSNVVVAALPQRLTTWANNPAVTFEPTPKVQCPTGAREPGRLGAEIFSRREVCVRMTDGSIRIAEPFWVTLNMDQKRILIMRALFRLMGLSEPTRTEAGRAVTLSFLEPEGARRQREAERNAPTFPLVRTGISGNGVREDQNQTDFEDYVISLIRGSIGISGGAQIARGTTALLGVDGRFHASVGGLAATSRREVPTSSRGALTALNASIDARGTLESNFSDRPLYRVNITASGSAMLILGLWVAVEANQFPSIRERIGRIGIGGTQSVRINSKSYVFVRLGVGANTASIHGLRWTNDADGSPLESTTTQGGMSGQLSALLQLSSFFIEFRGTIDQNSHEVPLTLSPDPAHSTHLTESPSTWRTSLSASLSIPLHALFSNDALRFEGEYLRYDGESDGDGYAQLQVEEITTLRTVYEFRF